MIHVEKITCKYEYYIKFHIEIESNFLRFSQLHNNCTFKLVEKKARCKIAKAGYNIHGFVNSLPVE